MSAPYAECDLDALAVDESIARYFVAQMYGACPQRFIPGLAPDVDADEVLARFADLASRRSIFLPLPAAAGLGGAGSLAPVSGLPAAPGAPNETRNE